MKRTLLYPSELALQSRYRLVEALAASERRARQLAKELEARVKELEEKTRQLDRANQALRQLAYHDSLTGLPNRSLFRDRLRTAIDRATRDNTNCAVLYVDLDNFKRVNDNHGHAAGDAVLVETAKRLRSSLRQTDTVARLGGDEFAVLIEGARRGSDARRVAQAVREHLKTPHPIGDQPIASTASVGIAVYPYDGQTASTLLCHADGDMYKQKRRRAADDRSVTAERLACSPQSCLPSQVNELAEGSSIRDYCALLGDDAEQDDAYESSIVSLGIAPLTGAIK